MLGHLKGITKNKKFHRQGAKTPRYRSCARGGEKIACAGGVKGFLSDLQSKSSFGVLAVQMKRSIKLVQFYKFRNGL